MTFVDQASVSSRSVEPSGNNPIYSLAFVRRRALILA